MHVIMVVEYFMYGGTEQAAVNLAKGLVKEGHKVKIFTTLISRKKSNLY